jgi:hypothetical protein
MRAERFAATPLPVPRQDPATSQAKAQAILSQHQFHHSESIPTRVLRWIADHLGRGVSDLLRGGWGTFVAWLVVIAAVALVVLVVVLVVRRTPHLPMQDEDAPVRVEVRRDARDWLAEADRLEAEGQWKAALRCRYRALTAGLVSKRLVRDLPGRTSGEYRDDLAVTVPRARDDFGAASDLFERAWYGDRATGAEESERFRAHAREVEALAEQPDQHMDRERVPS